MEQESAVQPCSSRSKLRAGLYMQEWSQQVEKQFSCSVILRLWAHIQESAMNWRECSEGPPRWLVLKRVMYQAVRAGGIEWRKEG